MVKATRSVDEVRRADETIVALDRVERSIVEEPTTTRLLEEEEVADDERVASVEVAVMET